MQNALQTICGGNPTCPSTHAANLVPVYDSHSGNGNNAGFRIKYIGAFQLKSYNIQGNNASMWARYDRQSPHSRPAASRQTSVRCS